MFRIIDKYIFREIFNTWLIVMLTLLAVLLTNQFARILGDVAKDKLPKDSVMDLILLSGLQYLTILIPIGLFLSILMALGRLYSNSEMSAMMACKVSSLGIFRPIILLTIPLVIISSWIAIDVGPKSILKIDKINNEAKRKLDLSSIEPGRFVVDKNLGTVIYAEEINESNELRNVFLRYITPEGEIEVVTAEKGNQIDIEDEDQRFFVLKNGKRYIGTPGTTDYLIMEFQEHGIPYVLPKTRDVNTDVKSLPFDMLITSDDSQRNAEFHWRIGIPISTLVLVLIAIPMSRSEPRQGQFSKIFSGILIFIIYYNLLSAGKSWLENSIVPRGIGLWWIHALMLVFLFALLLKKNGYFRRLSRVNFHK